MDYTQMTGRELLIANATHADEPAFRMAFMAAILAGKFQGMTQGCFQGIQKEALMSDQIPTSTQIADAICETVKNPNYLDMANLHELLETAARAGKLAGLQKAQAYVSSNWPQGQYDVFNEHRLNNQIKAAIKGTLKRLGRVRTDPETVIAALKD